MPLNKETKPNSINLNEIMLSQQGLEYTDCTPAEGLRLTLDGVSGYDTKLHWIVRIQFWRVWSTLPLPLLSGLLCPRVVIPVMGQIDV